MIRALFAFDPWRSAILLTGGDKTGEWKSWYEQAIHYVQELHAVYLKERAGAMSSFTKWDRDGYRRRVGEEEAARRRWAIIAEQWGLSARAGTEASGVHAGGHGREIDNELDPGRSCDLRWHRSGELFQIIAVLRIPSQLDHRFSGHIRQLERKPPNSLEILCADEMLSITSEVRC